MLNHVWIDLAGRTELRLFGVLGQGNPGGISSRTTNSWPSSGAGIPDLIQLIVILGNELPHDRVQPIGLVFHRFRELLVADIRDGQQRTDIGAGELFQSLGISDDVNAAADEKVSDHCTRGGIGGHLVNAHLTRACAAFEKEVV